MNPKNHFFILYCALFFLTVLFVCCLHRAQNHDECKRRLDDQDAILVKQSEILSINTVLLQAIFYQDRPGGAELPEISSELADVFQ